MPSLDVIIPTYNRSTLLSLALGSLLRAHRPDAWHITLVVVDNNSTDDTRAVVEAIAHTATLPVRYLRESRQSSSSARNTGILASQADFLGFIDDDEQVDDQWFEIIAREFADPATDFIGGPYYADPDLDLPDWLPCDYPAVIGIMQPRPRGVFGSTFTGNLNGGNSVFRRHIFEQVGLYSTELGRGARALLSEEDAELYGRVRAQGYNGIFVPDLVIVHHIPPDRLTVRYHRKWCFWRGVSQGLLARRHQREPVRHLLGIPRYRIGRSARAMVLLAQPLSGHSSAHRLNAELGIWDLAGYFYGRFAVRIDRFYEAAR